MVVVKHARPLAVLAASALAVAGIAASPLSANAAAQPPGHVAGQVLPQCFDHVLPASAGGFSDLIPLPTTLNFFGFAYNKLRVETDGKIDLSDGTNGGIIAPLFSNVDTTVAGSVTYGIGSDGVVCVIWNGVAAPGGSADVVNTFQLLLTPKTGTPGRVAGDFDITFNYDSVQYSTASNQHIGYVAQSPASTVAFLDPTGDDSVERIDGGASALVSHSQNSSQLGRYVIPVTNTASATNTGTLITATPVIAGTPKLGGLLAAVPGAWGPDHVALSYQWTRDGIAISAATLATYAVTKSDLGHILAVVVTGKRDFYTTASTTSAALPIAAPTTIKKVTIAGVAKVGSKLKAKTSGVKPSSAKLSYQWYAKGKKIAHATKSTYTVTKSVKGKKITVAVTAKKSGYTATTKTSKSTSKVK